MISDQDIDLLDKATPKLRKHIDLQSCGLLAHLRSRFAIDDEQEATIKAAVGRFNKIDALIECLRGGTADTIDKLVYAMRATRSPPLIELTKCLREPINPEDDWPSPSDLTRNSATDVPDYAGAGPCLSKGETKSGQKVYAQDGKGRALIVSVVDVKGAHKLPGNDVDCTDLNDLFEKKFKMNVIVYKQENGNDLTATGIEAKVKKVASEIPSGTQYFVLVLLSHGGEGDFICGSDGGTVGVEKLRSYFSSTNCPALTGRPKLTLLQACRGSEAAKLVDAAAAGHDRADEIIGYPTEAGFKSWTSPCEGSFFMQAVRTVFSANAKNTDVNGMLAMVNDEVARKIGQYTDTTDGLKKDAVQMSCVSHTLRGLWYLLPKK